MIERDASRPCAHAAVQWSSPSPGSPSTRPRRSTSTSSSRACAPAATSRSSSRWRTPTTPSAGVRTVYLPCKPSAGVHQQPLHPGDREVRWRRHRAWCRARRRPARARSASRRGLIHSTETDAMSYDDQTTTTTTTTTIDDSDAFVRATNGYVGDAETLLRRAIDIIATAPTMPLSSSPRIDRDEIIELLEEALHRLPEEMRQARWMIKERQEFVAKTRREADELLEAARVQAERMVQRTEVVRAAEQRARQIIEAAESRRPPPAPRDRGLPRPAARQLRDPARQAAEDGRTPGASRLSIGAHRGASTARATTTTRRRASSTRTGDAPDRPPGGARFLDARMPNLLRVNTIELLRRPGSERPSTSRCPGRARHRRRPRSTTTRRCDVDLHLESLTDGIVVHGTVSCPWHGTCRRCLVPAAGDARQRGATSCYQQVRHRPRRVRDRRRPARPRARWCARSCCSTRRPTPLCRDDCAGLCPTCGADRNAAPCSCERPRSRRPLGCARPARGLDDAGRPRRSALRRRRASDAAARRGRSSSS